MKLKLKCAQALLAVLAIWLGMGGVAFSANEQAVQAEVKANLNKILPKAKEASKQAQYLYDLGKDTDGYLAMMNGIIARIEAKKYYHGQEFRDVKAQMYSIVDGQVITNKIIANDTAQIAAMLVPVSQGSIDWSGELESTPAFKELVQDAKNLATSPDLCTHKYLQGLDGETAQHCGKTNVRTGGAAQTLQKRINELHQQRSSLDAITGPMANYLQPCVASTTKKAELDSAGKVVVSAKIVIHNRISICHTDLLSGYTESSIPLWKKQLPTTDQKYQEILTEALNNPLKNAQSISSKLSAASLVFYISAVKRVDGPSNDPFEYLKLDVESSIQLMKTLDDQISAFMQLDPVAQKAEGQTIPNPCYQINKTDVELQSKCSNVVEWWLIHIAAYDASDPIWQSCPALTVPDDFKKCLRAADGAFSDRAKEIFALQKHNSLDLREALIVLPLKVQKEVSVKDRLSAVVAKVPKSGLGYFGVGIFLLLLGFKVINKTHPDPSSTKGEES